MTRRFIKAIPGHEQVRGECSRWSSSVEYRASTLSALLQMDVRKKGPPSHYGLNCVRPTAAASIRNTLPRTIAADTLIRCNLVPVCAIRGETIIYMNERCSTLLGRSGNELDIDVPLQEIVTAADWPRVLHSLLRATTEPGSRTSITFSAVRRDGSIADLELAYAVAPGSKPEVLVSVVSDITDKARAFTQLNYLAFNDALTGLPNRALFFDRLRQTLVASRRSRQGFALLACDLDDFKTVNDIYGHEAGDAALQIAAERLSSCCREVDTVARMGGDEFVLVLPGVVEPSHAALVANRVITVVGEPFSLGGLSCCVGVSVGIAFYPQNGQTIETLLRSADAAMYESKKAGKSRFGFADQRNLDASASGLRFMARADVHETGIGPADAQHQKLAAMIGRLGIDFAAGEDVQRLHATFDAMIAFAQSHFADEEALMDRYEIEDRVAHQQMHRKLLQDAKSLAKGLDDSSMMLIMASLHEWLLQHIESADMPLARRLHEKGYVDTPR